MLIGKVVSAVSRHSDGEVGIEFSDGTRLFMDITAAGIEISITVGK